MLTEPKQPRNLTTLSSMGDTECRICGKSFPSRHSVANHRSMAHTGEEIKEVMLEALIEMGEELGRTPEAREMEQDGPYSQNTYQNRFGSWNEAIQQAGFERTRVFDPKELECSNCGETLTKCYRRAERHEYHYCSSGCISEWQEEHYSGEGNPRYKKKEVECSNCGTALFRADWELRSRNHHYCDMDCRGEHWQKTGVRSGENSPRWQGGGPHFYGENWSIRREQVIERDGHTCQSCALTREESYEVHGCDLHVHHRVPLREFEEPEAANELTNLVTLCRTCHKQWEQLPVQFQVVD